MPTENHIGEFSLNNVNNIVNDNDNKKIFRL
jgi:hypothetical protein